GRSSGLRARLVSDRSRRRLGALQLRLLELGWPVGLDVGRLRAVGLCSLSLWPLGVHWRGLGVGVLAGRRLSSVWTGLCRLRWWRALGLQLWFRWRYRLVPARLGRTLSSVVWLQPHLHS